MRKTKTDGNTIKARLAGSVGEMRKFGIKRIGLFGSAVRGEGKKDIDILVEFEAGQEKFDNLTGLYFYLQDMLGRNIDLVTRGSLSPYLAPSILAEVEYIETAS